RPRSPINPHIPYTTRFRSPRYRTRPQSGMSGYNLTPTAQTDLTELRDYYLKEAGRRVARQILVEFVEAFRFLARSRSASQKTKRSEEHTSEIQYHMNIR